MTGAPRRERVRIYRKLLEAMPLTSDRLTRFVYDISGRSGWYARLAADARALRDDPDTHLDQATDHAQWLLRDGSPRELVRDVLIAECDADRATNEPGWQGWRENTWDTHELMRNAIAEATLDADERAEVWAWRHRDGYGPLSLEHYADEE